MISTSNISLRVGKKALFEDVNIKFTEGNCYGLIGANGAGKSTLFNCIGGSFLQMRGAFIWMTATLPMCRSTSAQLRSGGSFRIR